jgi:hypothetical protein
VRGIGAVCSFALALHPDRRRAGTGIGSAGPVPLGAPEAERFLEGVLSEHGLWEAPRPLGDAVRAKFADLISCSVYLDGVLVCSGGQPVPVHRLPEDHQRGPRGGTEHQLLAWVIPRGS